MMQCVPGLHLNPDLKNTTVTQNENPIDARVHKFIINQDKTEKILSLKLPLLPSKISGVNLGPKHTT